MGEGDFDAPSRGRSPVKGERSQAKKYPDNLKPEGEFEGKPKEHAPKGDRAGIKKHPDNLKMEGDHLMRDRSKSPVKGERAQIKKHPDNLKMTGDFEGPKPNEAPSGERAPMK